MLFQLARVHTPPTVALSHIVTQYRTLGCSEQNPGVNHKEQGNLRLRRGKCVWGY